jgi:hypothetical protein
MRFKLMLMTCRIGEFEKPTGAVEQDDEDDEGSPYAGAILIEPQAQAVRALLERVSRLHVSTDRSETYHIISSDRRMAVMALGLGKPTGCQAISVNLRSLAPDNVELLFELMRAGDLFISPRHHSPGSHLPGVVLSEERKQHIAEHIPGEPVVCSSVADLQRFLTEEVERCRRMQPERYEEGWEEMMDDARDAGWTLTRDRAGGEQAFQDLLVVHPDDGGVYFVRGQAYEKLGEKALAAADYRKADELMHEEDLMKSGVRRALARVTG